MAVASISTTPQADSRVSGWTTAADAGPVRPATNPYGRAAYPITAPARASPSARDSATATSSRTSATAPATSAVGSQGGPVAASATAPAPSRVAAARSP